MHGPHRSTEQFQVFLEDLRESFWGVVQGKVRDTLRKLLEGDSEQRMEEYLGLKWYERAEEREDSRNGFYERDYVTPWGIIRFRVRRTRCLRSRSETWRAESGRRFLVRNHCCRS